MLNDYVNFIKFYVDDIKGTGYLAFRDLPLILKSYCGAKALDFGCGAGRSSNYLHRLGYAVTGVDINLEMIERAKINLPACEFVHLNNVGLPFENNCFDIVFNSFVLFDMSSKDEITAAFKEMKRVCKKGGKIVSIVNSDYLFIKKWLTVDNDFEQNKNLISGDIARLYLSDVGVDIYDYYWADHDYMDCFERAGLINTDRHQSLGHHDEAYNWNEELNYPPYTIFICSV